MARGRSTSNSGASMSTSPSEVVRSSVDTGRSMSVFNWFRKHRNRGEGDNSIHEGVVLRTALKAPAPPKTGNLQVEVEYLGFPEGSIRAGDTRLKISICVMSTKTNEIESEVEDVDSYVFAGLTEGSKTVLLRTRETLISAVPTKVISECCTAVKVSLRKIPCGTKVVLAAHDIFLEGCTATIFVLEEDSGRFTRQCETRINSSGEAVFLVDRHDDIPARKYKLVIADEEGKQCCADIFPIKLRPFLMTSICESQPMRMPSERDTPTTPPYRPSSLPEPGTLASPEERRTVEQLRALLLREKKRMADLEIAYMRLLGEKEVLLGQAADLRSKLECPLCFDNLKNVILLPCRHEFCCDCIMKDKSTKRSTQGEALAATCPVCRLHYEQVLCRDFVAA